VITPAKATIVPPEPPKTPAPPPVAAVPAAAAPAPESPVEAVPHAAAASEKTPPPTAATPSKPGKEEKVIEAAPAVSTEGRAKASGRRGIRLKLIKPGENDPGLK